MKNVQLQTIELHPRAPAKPAYGGHCNGCGVCCAAEPCPIAFVFLWQFRGQCRALLWQNSTQSYVCGLIVAPERYVTLLPRRWRGRFGKFIASRVAAGKGCDFAAEVLAPAEARDPRP